jgi:cytochrome P450
MSPSNISITINAWSFILLFVIVLFSYAFYKLYVLVYSWPKNFIDYFARQGISGAPYKFPLGQLETINKWGEDGKALEYAFEMKEKYGPIHTLQFGPMPQLVTYDPEVCRHIFNSKTAYIQKCPDYFREPMKPLLRNGLILSEGSYWKQMRTIVSPGFHFWYLQEMVPIICDSVQSWVNTKLKDIDNSPNNEILLDLTHDMATITLDSVATAAFGNSFREDRARANKLIKTLINVCENVEYRVLNMLAFIPIIYLYLLVVPSIMAAKKSEP